MLKGLLKKSSSVLRRSFSKSLVDPAEFDLINGRTSLHGGHPKEALAHYQTAIAKSPSNMEAYMGACICLLQLGLHEEALALTKKAKTIHSGMTDFLGFQVESLMQLGRIEEIDEAAFLRWRDKSDLHSTGYYAVCSKVLEALLSREAVNASFCEVLIRDLLQQLDESLSDINPSALCSLAFVLWTGKSDAFARLMVVVSHLLAKESIDPLLRKSTATFFLTFGNFIGLETRKALIAKFFLQFEIKAHWAFILMHSHQMERIAGGKHKGVEDSFENIAITAEILGSIEKFLVTASPKQLYTILQLASICRPEMRGDIVVAMRRHIEEQSVESKAYKDDLKFIIEHSRPPQEKNISFLTKRTLRIAVCVSGQMRGYKEAFPSWQHWGLDAHETSYFVHTWQRTGIALPTPGLDKEVLPAQFQLTYRNVWNKYGREDMLARYPNFFALWGDEAEVSKSQLSEFYGTDAVVIDDDTLAPFYSFSNPRKMYYKIAQCHELARNSGEFDLMIRVRPDLNFGKRKLELQEIYANTASQKTAYVYFQPRHYCFPGIGYCMADVLAIGSPEAMDGYAAADAMTMREGDYANLQHFPTQHIAHGNLAYATLYHGLDLRWLQYKCIDTTSDNTDLIRCYRLAPDLIRTALQADATGRMDQADLELLATL